MTRGQLLDVRGTDKRVRNHRFAVVHHERDVHRTAQAGVHDRKPVGMYRESGSGAIIENTKPAGERPNRGFSGPLRSVGPVQIGNRRRISLDGGTDSPRGVSIGELDIGDHPPLIIWGGIVQLYPQLDTGPVRRNGVVA